MTVKSKKKNYKKPIFFHYRKKYTCSDYNLSKGKGLVDYGRNEFLCFNL